MLLLAPAPMLKVVSIDPDKSVRKILVYIGDLYVVNDPPIYMYPGISGRVITGTNGCINANGVNITYIIFLTELTKTIDESNVIIVTISIAFATAEPVYKEPLG